jgi:hypothetical protein
VITERKFVAKLSQLEFRQVRLLIQAAYESALPDDAACILERYPHNPYEPSASTRTTGPPEMLFTLPTLVCDSSIDTNLLLANIQRAITRKVAVWKDMSNGTIHALRIDSAMHDTQTETDPFVDTAFARDTKKVHLTVIPWFVRIHWR